jgi:hypothetical protein
MKTTQTHGTMTHMTMSQMTTAHPAAPQSPYRACASMPAFMPSQRDAGDTQKHDALSDLVPR